MLWIKKKQIQKRALLERLLKVLFFHFRAWQSNISCRYGRLEFALNNTINDQYLYMCK